MTKNETVKLFALIHSLFPREEAFKNATIETVGAWAKALCDIRYEDAEKAIMAVVATSSFPPSIAEIRDFATRANAPRRLTADEAWGHALDIMRRYGMNLIKISDEPDEPPAKFGEPVRIRKSKVEWEAKSHCRPEVWSILKDMGYQDMCCAENLDVARGQFMRAWTAHDQEAKEYRVMGTLLPEYFNNALLTQGQNGEL